MTGYFSRLAERTGLGFASPSTRAARTANGGLAPSPEFARESAAPLHAEEITFVAQTQGDAHASPTQSAGDAFRDAARERAGDFARTRRDAEHTGDSTPESATRPSDANTADERESETLRRRRLSNSGDQFHSFPEEAEIRAASTSQRRTSRERETENYESSDGVNELPRRTNAAESSPVVTNQARAREPQHREETLESPYDFNSPLEREAIGGMSRAEIYQDYLREVRKWVAEDAPATLDEGMLNERSSVAAARAEDAHGYVRERDLGTQDFNLSIGTISIVVEETPPPQTVMQTTPPARAERAQPARSSRSSGRNYLRFK